MLADVTFPIFLPSEEWTKKFKELEYDNEKIKEFGSPFISNQDEELKVAPGIYYTGLNPEHWFEQAGLDTVELYFEAYDLARKDFDTRKEKDMPFISLSEIVEMYKLSLFGSFEHEESGVCDNPEQILDKWPHLESSAQRHFITMTPIYKEDQPQWGGWRWHKWGEYIGDHEIQCEYLYDEEDIEVVYVFRIHTLKPESGLGYMPEDL